MTNTRKIKNQDFKFVHSGVCMNQDRQSQELFLLQVSTNQKDAVSRLSCMKNVVRLDQLCIRYTKGQSISDNRHRSFKI